MKPIKFRFWNKLAHRFQPPSKYAIQGDGQCIGYDYEMMAWDDPFDIEKSFIVAQQYTGLTDKNSKEIYEGDILKYTFDGDSYPEEAVDKIFICEWDQNNAWFVFKEHDDDVSDAYYWLEIKGYCEVIGNIFENSELLKQ